MTTYNQPNMTYVNDGAISDGVVIAASGIRLTNIESGRITGGVTFTAGGSTLTNEQGGQIFSATDYYNFPGINSITGSNGDDTVINRGSLYGNVDLGSGSDIFRLEIGGAVVGTVNGGSGIDELVTSTTTAQLLGSSYVNFERLTVYGTANAFLNLVGFSDYSNIFFQGLPTGPNNGLNLVDSNDPLANLTFAGGSVVLTNSVVRSATGGADNDWLQVATGSSIIGDVSLGDGNDYLTLLAYGATDALGSVGGAVSGGNGNDTLNFVSPAPYRTFNFDLSRTTGFEILKFNADYGSLHDVLWTVSNADSTVSTIEIGQGTALTLEHSVLRAHVVAAFSATFVLASDSVVATIGGRADAPPLNPNETQGYSPASSSLTINGQVLYEVRLYTGDDLLDARNGTVGGTIYGNAGNDRLWTGAGNNIIDGGAGADWIEGGAGADTLTGGSGKDQFRGTVAELNGDTITDFSVGDRITVSDANVRSFTFQLNGTQLSFAGTTLTLGTAPTGRLVASSTGTDVSIRISSATVADDFNGDGHSDILWRNASGQLSNWLSTTPGGADANDGNAAAGAPTSWHVMGSGDFNGDGRSDILWRSDSGQLSNWLAKANGGFTPNDANALTTVPTNWHVTGIGDFNGDGRDDILWRSDNGQFSNWLSKANGGFTANDANAFASVPTAWQVVATGDFNGDGRDDVLWRRSTGELSDWLANPNGGFTPNDAKAATGAPTNWHVVATGDFNGDGRDDILWRSDSGQLSNWIANIDGGFASNDAVALTSVGTNWHVVGTGDYNGDGFADILWRSDGGQLSNWLGNSTGGFTNNDSFAFAAVGTDWQVQGTELHFV